MQNFPILKTSLRGLELHPFQRKHLPFLVDLLENPEIQKTLFRQSTAIDTAHEEKALDKMHGHTHPKEITYILTLKKLLSETYIGYVKIKIIDWAVKSCYLSVAILPDAQFRGKGYAKASYDSFFTYLFSLGILKIYGRTNENNFATIRLNEATGFRLVGRQTAFMLYPNGAVQDDLLFERLSPALERHQQVNAAENEHLVRIFSPLQQARIDDHVTSELLDKTLIQLQALTLENSASARFVKEVKEELVNEQRTLQQGNAVQRKGPDLRIFADALAENTRAASMCFFAHPITVSQYQNLTELYERLQKGTPNEQDTRAIWYGSYTPENWDYLRFFFLGRTPKYTMSAIMRILQQ